MKVVLVDCLIYQGLLCYQRRRAAGSPDRDEPITIRMKRAQSHGYSGWWSIENRFDLWRGFRIEHPDSIYFHGSAILSIPPGGQGGTGIMYGATYISVQGYNARLDVVNEIRDATVDPDGGLRLRIEVVRRHRAEEEGDPPDRRFRESMRSRDFEVRLRPVAGVPNELRGEHDYTRATEVFSSGTERYVHLNAAPSR